MFGITSKKESVFHTIFIRFTAAATSAYSFGKSTPAKRRFSTTILPYVIVSAYYTIQNTL
jgi:hypothetical protein